MFYDWLSLKKYFIFSVNFKLKDHNQLRTKSSKDSLSSSSVTCQALIDIFRPRLIVCSKVFQVVFVHCIYNSTLLTHCFLILGNCPTWCTNSFQCIYLFIVLYMFRACHAHDTATNTEWQLPEAVLIQSVSPDDEHDMLETCREL